MAEHEKHAARTSRVTGDPQFLVSRLIWGVPRIGVPPIAGWFLLGLGKKPITMDDDWGYPYVRKPPQKFMVLVIDNLMT